MSFEPDEREARFTALWMYVGVVMLCAAIVWVGYWLMR